MHTLEHPAQLLTFLDEHRYIADGDLATAMFLLMKLRKPLLIEGPPGVGKTEAAIVLSQWLETELIRLQCYEGLDVNSAVYEWNYQRQLLSIRLQEGSGLSAAEKEQHLFGKDYLLARPLLQSISAPGQSPVLLIDELDRSDEEFEAYLLELLSAFQISIPEMGTVKAVHPPYVVLTSNRTRELSDALKRRCLYHWIGYPSFDKEMAIVRKRLPDMEEALMAQVVNAVQRLRQQKLTKVPGISETIDWANALLALGLRRLDAQSLEQTLGVVLKSVDDMEHIRAAGPEALLA